MLSLSTKSTVLLVTDIPGQHLGNGLRALSMGYYNFNTPIAKSLPEKTVSSLCHGPSEQGRLVTLEFFTTSWQEALSRLWGEGLLSCLVPLILPVLLPRLIQEKNGQGGRKLTNPGICWKFTGSPGVLFHSDNG